MNARTTHYYCHILCCIMKHAYSMRVFVKHENYFHQMFKQSKTFSLVSQAEPLCLSMIQLSCICGFSKLCSEVKVLAYVDDDALFCTDKPSVKNVVSTFEKFGVISGAH